MIKKFNGELVSISDEAKDCKKVVVHLRDEFSYVPGQYCMIALPNNEEEGRAFSIVEVEEDNITFCIKKNKEFTENLFKCKSGDKIFIFGPYGRFNLPYKENDLIFIAGGIGITPLYSMITEAIRKKYNKKITLFYSGRKREDMCLLKELNKIKETNFSQYLYLTQEGDSRVNVDEIKNKVDILDKQLIYLCGPLQMMTSLKNQLLENGIKEEQIRLEDFG